jgi:hypothetical protein
MMGILTGGFLGIVIALFLLALAILWFILPFAIFGTKDKLSELIAESRQTNAHLAALRTEISEIKGNNNLDLEHVVNVSKSSPSSNKTSDWICQNCSEENGPSFEVCWSCQLNKS